LNGIVTWLQANWGGLWSGRFDAQAFSDALQAVIVPNAGGAATPTA
jgi:hypothetical protein